MADIGNVLHVRNAIAEVAKVSGQNVEADVALGVAQMRMAIDRRPANIHPDPSGLQRLELLFIPRQTVMKLQSHLFNCPLTRIYSVRKIIRHGLTQIYTVFFSFISYA